MRLTRVRINGFKTFADRTEVDLDGEMIAVVGPNGCGKSNFVDAILWALGEANPRNLRAQTGADVIFNGSTHRKPVGFAEVTLIFDNEDGQLPIDQSEVSVTRRISRSGESQYYINRQLCRQRDVYDLLADTGLGKTGYAIVSQKEIDAALSASPDERRAWVDEAAGIQRFRLRRQEAMRRLTSVEDRLVQVDAIVREIEAQRGPLEKEAEEARRYKAIQAGLRELETSLLGFEFTAADRECSDAVARIETATKAQNRMTEEIGQVVVELAEASKEVSETEQELDVVRGLQQSTLTAFERASARIDLARQRLASLNQIEAGLRNSDEDFELRTRELADDRDRVILQLELAKSEREQHLNELSTGSAAFSNMLADLQCVEQELDAAKMAQKNWLEAQGAAAERKSRLEEAKRELAGVMAAIPELNKAVAEAEAAVSNAKAAFDQAKAEADSAEALRRQVLSELDASSARQRERLAELAGIEARWSALSSTIEAQEGLSQGAQAVLQLAKEGRLRGTYVPVVEAIIAPPALALAIETALGAAANDLIVEDDRTAKAAIQLLKEGRLGRATFQPIAMMKPFHRPDVERILRMDGIEGLAIDLVQCEASHLPVIQSLLGRVVIARTLDDALAAASTQGWSKIVTLDGEVVTHSGAVTGGVFSRRSQGLLQRKSELTDLEARQRELKATLAEGEREIARLQESLVNIKSQSPLEELRKGLQDAERWHSDLSRELQESVRTRGRLEAEVLAVQETTDVPAPPDVSGLEHRRESLMKAIATAEAERSGVDTRLAELDARIGELSQALRALDTRIRQLAERQEKQSRASLEIAPERADWQQKLATAEVERNRAEEEKRAAEARYNMLSQKRRTSLERAYELSERQKALEQDLKLQEQEAHRCEILRAKADAKRAVAAQRLMEEYGLTPSEVQVQGEPSPDAAATVQRLRRELRGLGDVNLGAIEAYERLTERFAEIDSQRRDVVESKEQLLESIAELDRAAKGRFVETFERLQSAVGVTFQRIFGGGEANLVLTEAESILDAGVNMEVTIPGKRKQRAELLSGGERALCACAFLFALLQIRSSPLVVLDEVDAPLDGRNVERFVELIRSFKETTQFIVVTHNNVTIAAAPIWFGVTMSEPGVSKILPYKYPDQNLVKEVVPEAYLKG